MLLWSYYRGDKEVDQNRAEVADEKVEQSKHFDEEAPLANPDKKAMAGSSKAGGGNKQDYATTSKGHVWK